MTLFRTGTACLVLALAAGPAAGAVADVPAGFEWRKETNTAFQVGETLTYVVKYGFIHAGFATVEVTDILPMHGRPAYHILSRARTNRVMDAIFKVRDKNESLMDVQSLCSLRFYQRIREGLYQRENWSLYDHPRGTFVYTKRRKGKEEVIQGGIPAYVQDVLSALYYVRTRDLAVGMDVMVDANSGGKTWPMKVHVRRVETIRVPAGKFECFHIEPILAGEGIFQQQGRLEVWLTKDARKIPVLLRSRVLVGAFDAELTGNRLTPDLLEGKGLDEIDPGVAPPEPPPL